MPTGVTCWAGPVSEKGCVRAWGRVAHVSRRRYTMGEVGRWESLSAWHAAVVVHKRKGRKRGCRPGWARPRHATVAVHKVGATVTDCSPSAPLLQVLCDAPVDDALGWAATHHSAAPAHALQARPSASRRPAAASAARTAARAGRACCSAPAAGRSTAREQDRRVGSPR